MEDNSKNAQKKKLYITEFDIFRFLAENSSEKKPVSINLISAYFSRCIEYAEDAGLEDFHDLKKKTFSAVLSEVKKHIDSADINESVRTYVKRTVKKYLDSELLPGFFIARKTTEKTSSKTSAEKVYFIRTPLSENQIILLRDAISVFPYAEQNKTADIVNSLNKLTPVYNREKYCPEIVNADKYRGSYYENLEEIRKAFAGIMGGKRNGEIKKLRFIYCKYNEKKELVPSVRDGKETREVNPVKVLWANGYYYLVAFYIENEKVRYINFRIDRMKKVECLEENAESIQAALPRESKKAIETKQTLKKLKKLGRDFSGVVNPKDIENSKRFDDSGFSVAKYKSAHPVMYTEKELPIIRIKCRTERMNNAIDTFGFDFETAPADNPDEVIITLRNTDSQGVKMWVLEYGDTCEILEPAELRDDIRSTLEKMLAKYK